VRVAGTPAGSVESIELSERNTAMATLRLRDDVPRPRADAAAVVRPVDLLGDTYLSLSPGSAAEPLRGPIPLARSASAPRLDELLRAFDRPARTGLQAVLVELGIGLDNRGADLNQATVALKPALDAADGLMRELGSQNASLRSLVQDAHRATEQLAAHDQELGGAVTSLAALLEETAAHAPELAAGLQGLPPTLASARRTAGRLEGAAAAATPLARRLDRAAPGLATASQRLKPFLDAADRATGELIPTVEGLTEVLEASTPTGRRLAGGLRSLQDASPELRSFLSALKPAAPAISEGFFVNFADEAEEPGTQPFDPFADPARNYWRGAAVFSCESFGVKIAPGCLDAFLARGSGRADDRRSARARRAESRAQDDPPPKPVEPGGGEGSLEALVQDPVGKLTGRLRKGVDELTRHVRDGVGGLRDRIGRLGGSPSGSTREDDARLLDFLLGP
jgi:phospholipid/cholesterol/gamma-HCH transport system substrate-binding protein